MNVYGTPTGYTSEAIGIAASQSAYRPTIEGVLALADQLQAATSDVWSAWNDLKFGVRPEVPMPPATLDRALSADRLQRIVEQMGEDVARLRALANEITERI